MLIKFHSNSHNDWGASTASLCRCNYTVLIRNRTIIVIIWICGSLFYRKVWFSRKFRLSNGCRDDSTDDSKVKTSQFVFNLNIKLTLKKHITVFSIFLFIYALSIQNNQFLYALLEWLKLKQLLNKIMLVTSIHTNIFSWIQCQCYIKTEKPWIS